MNDMHSPWPAGMKKFLVRNDADKITEIMEQLNVAVIFHLHYFDSIEDEYYPVIRSIRDKHIDLYVTYSDERVKTVLEKLNSGGREIRFVRKENRGRDISAILVAMRETVQQYDLVCFIHDKKSKLKMYDSDIAEWKNIQKKCLLGSGDGYIANVLKIFNDNPSLGLLVPPYILAPITPINMLDLWGTNYDAVATLAKRFHLQAEIKRDNIPAALGTVFWARTAALKKLLDYPWKYEDFPGEPLPDDGTLSHALERIIPFFAEDAGFATGYIYNEDCVLPFMQNAMNRMQKFGETLDKRCGMKSLHSIDFYEENLKKLTEFASCHRKLLIFGNGGVARECMQLMETNGMHASAFVVSDGMKKTDQCHGIPVLEISEIMRTETINEEFGLIASVGPVNMEKILSEIALHFPGIDCISFL